MFQGFVLHENGHDCKEGGCKVNLYSIDSKNVKRFKKEIMLFRDSEENKSIIDIFQHEITSSRGEISSPHYPDHYPGKKVKYQNCLFL